MKLVVGCWAVGFLSAISSPCEAGGGLLGGRLPPCRLLTLQKTRLWFCGPDVIDHDFCDSAPLLKLSCSDTSYFEHVDFFLSLLFVPATVLRIVVSYVLTAAAALHVPSPSGRQKASSTCASHPTAVVVGYSGTVFM